jgi:hypothetical protein
MLLDAISDPVNDTVRLVETANGLESAEPANRAIIQDHAEDHGTDHTNDHGGASHD